MEWIPWEKLTTSVIGIGISFVFLLVLNIWVALAMAVTTALFFRCIRCGSSGCFGRGCKSAGGTEQAGWNGH